MTCKISEFYIYKNLDETSLNIEEANVDNIVSGQFNEQFNEQINYKCVDMENQLTLILGAPFHLPPESILFGIFTQFTDEFSLKVLEIQLSKLLLPNELYTDENKNILFKISSELHRKNIPLLLKK